MMSARRPVLAVVVVALVVSGCGESSSSAGEPVAAAPTTRASDSASPGQASASASDTAAGQTSTPSTTVEPTSVEPGTVDAGEFTKKPQAVAVAEFYEQLWTSYQTGRVTPGLARLTTDSALRTFRTNVEDLAELGHTVAELNAARVVQVDGAEVVVCMSSSSYQRLETRTGAAVNPKVPGVTEYAVQLKKSPWRVDAVQGTKKPSCRKGSS